MKVRDAIRLLESNRAFKHPEKPMVVTVPGNANDDLPIGTLKSILRKAEIEDV
jgi:predicted RNA binding protein YcfA (HicA-like mRNA interferase family)